MAAQPQAPEQRTIDVDVQDIDTRGRTLHGYAAVYDVESDDLGGFRERIAPGAFAGVLDADVRALLNHDPYQVLGRTKSGTLRLSTSSAGCASSSTCPRARSARTCARRSRRGDLDGASFRFVVGQGAWDGDVRTVETVKELKDVTRGDVRRPTRRASVELRTRDAARGAEEETEGGRQQSIHEVRDGRGRAPRRRPGRCGSRNAPSCRTFQSLTGGVQVARFPAEVASVAFDEFRAVTFDGGTVTSPQHPRHGRRAVRRRPPVRLAGGPATWPSTPASRPSTCSSRPPGRWPPARPSSATSTRSRRSPRRRRTLAITNVPLKQVAAIQTDIPNVYLERAELATVVETDLRLAVNEGLDKLVLDGLATSGFQAPSTDKLLVSIRKAMTTIQASGYTPDTLVLTPANAETLDTLVSGITGGTTTTTSSGRAGSRPARLFGLNVVHLEGRPRAGRARLVRDREAVRRADHARQVRGGRRHHEHDARSGSRATPPSASSAPPRRSGSRRARAAPRYGLGVVFWPQRARNGIILTSQVLALRSIASESTASVWPCRRGACSCVASAA